MLAGTSADALTESDKDEIKSMIREYLVENPEILQEMITALETRRAEAERIATEKGIIEHQDALFRGDDAFVAGNPNGSVTLVEFFDYRCGYCKRAMKDLQKLIADNPDLRVVFKDYPVLGPDSLVASRAAIAAAQQGKYAQFHFGLMGRDGPVTEEAIFAVADEIGLDVNKLKKDMESEAVDKVLEENYALADALNIQGTPNFIIGDQLVAGARGYDFLSETIADIQENGCKVC